MSAIQRPSLALAGLQIGGALTDYYSMKDRYKGVFQAREWDKTHYNYRGTTLPNSLRGGQ